VAIQGGRAILTDQNKLDSGCRRWGDGFLVVVVRPTVIFVRLVARPRRKHVVIGALLRKVFILGYS